MSKRLILVLTFAFVVGISFAAYAEVQNVKVSGDLTISGIARTNLTLCKDQDAEDFNPGLRAVLSQARVRVDADLTDNVSTTVRLLNERIWGAEKDQTSELAGNDQTANYNDTEIDLDLAYVTLKEFLYSPLTLTIGRQELRFGNALIIGDPDTNGIAAGHGAGAGVALNTNRILPNSLDDLSIRKAFDAIRATLNYDPLVVDLVWSKINENAVAVFDDVDLYGVNAGYTVNKDLHTEAYLWQRTRDVGSTGIPVTQKPEVLRVLGVRGVYTGIENLILGLEGAYESGNHNVNNTLYPDDLVVVNGVSRKVCAFAIQLGAMYVMPQKKYMPMIGGSYTYLSGDKYLSTDDQYRGWDPMFEDQGAGTLNNKIAAQSNTQTFNVNGSMRPMDDLTVKLDYSYIMLNQPYTSAATGVTLSGVVGDPTYAMKGEKKYFGSEWDLGLTYDYTEDVQFGLLGGLFIPGTAFEKSNKKPASQVIGSMKVTF